MQGATVSASTDSTPSRRSSAPPSSRSPISREDEKINQDVLDVSFEIEETSRHARLRTAPENQTCDVDAILNGDGASGSVFLDDGSDPSLIDTSFTSGTLSTHLSETTDEVFTESGQETPENHAVYGRDSKVISQEMGMKSKRAAELPGMRPSSPHPRKTSSPVPSKLMQIPEDETMEFPASDKKRVKSRIKGERHGCQSLHHLVRACLPTCSSSSTIW